MISNFVISLCFGVFALVLLCSVALVVLDEVQRKLDEEREGE